MLDSSRGKPVSLADVYAFRALPQLELISVLTRLELRGELTPARDALLPDEPEFRDGCRVALKHARTLCGELGLLIAIDQIDRIERAISKPDVKFVEYLSMMGELRNRVLDEMRRDVILVLDRRLAGYFEKNAGFGEAVSTAFPGAIIDIEEASRCLAVERGTACVLHLMRVMESAVHSLANRLRIDYEYRGWDAVIRKMRSELESSYPEMDPSMKGMRDFYSNALDRLTGVKDALRNPTMHARIHYDVQRAEEVFWSVRTFMQLAAEKLQEVPE